MTKEMKFFNEHRTGHLATVENGDTPRVRIFSIIGAEDNRIILGTTKNKKVYEQLKEHPRAEWLASSKEYTVLRATGDVVFENDPSTKLRIIDENPAIRKMYGEAAEQLMEIFYLENLEFNWFDMSNAF